MSVDPSVADATLAILAGGEGARMGCPKAWLRIGARPILEYLCDELRWPGPTLLVTSPGREQPPGHTRFGLEAIDPIAGLGPLRGLLTALEHVTTPLLLITTVDMPGIRPAHLLWLLAQSQSHPQACGWLIERVTPAGACVEPFPSLFRIEARQTIAAHLAAGARSVRSLTQLPGFVTLRAPSDWPVETWLNLNTPDDLDAVTAFAASRPIKPGR